MYLCARMSAQNTNSNVETAKELGLLEEEYHKIVEILEREPNFDELSIFAVMWSEHCSYKNSITLLKTLPKEGPLMLAEAGEENAGLVDIGDGLACCFKIESHNHPSAIEPYQGAATGVGGINRDIFSMGARPIAQLNSLRFGNLATERTKWLVKGVVKGIGDYGNAFGIPTVGGEVYFDDCYETNILVNAMSVGIAEVGKTASAVADGPGNPVYIFGSTTGKDGIHGAAFASKDMSEDSVDDLPSVQVGDPFWEKLILEASLELLETGAVVGMQDMGAAGITCSTSEMAAKSGTGMAIHLDKAPQREKNMKSWEILLSESQERMLVILHKGREKEAEKIFEKWDLTYEQIGEVTDTERVQFFMNNKIVADIPAESLVLGGGAPIYQREWTEPTYLAKNRAFDLNSVQDITSADIKSVAEKITALPNIASKKWVYRQYDSMVGTVNQSTNKKSDAAIVKVKGTKKSLALTVDCNSRYVFAEPIIGAQIAVAEAARNIVCSGGIPAAVTNCLNFGNPYDKEVYYQFKHAVEGMGIACKYFNTPVTGGNVSFYNQHSDGTSVYPTPTIGMIGLLEDSENQMTLDFKNEGDVIYVLGKEVDDLNSSQYLAKLKKVEHSSSPYFDIDEEGKLHNTIVSLIENNKINHCHDISEGGTFISLLESAMTSGIGFEANSNESIRLDAGLFGEAQGRAIVSVSADAEADLLTALGDLPYRKLGTVKGNNVVVNGQSLGSVADFKFIYDNALGKALEA